MRFKATRTDLARRALLIACSTLTACGAFTLVPEGASSNLAAGDDSLMLHHAAQGFAVGSMLAELAPGHSHDARVVALARDSGALAKNRYRDLMAVAQSHGAAGEPSPGPDDAAQVSALSRLYGRAFDRRYLSLQVPCLQTTLERLQVGAGDGASQDTRDLFNQTIPQLQTLLARSRALAETITPPP